ncbi:DUF4291 family protein [Streptomyces sp. NPDC054794]
MNDQHEQNDQPVDQEPRFRIRARHTESTVTVHQAYRPGIGLPAARNGRFPSTWKRDRMTWVIMPLWQTPVRHQRPTPHGGERVSAAIPLRSGCDRRVLKLRSWARIEPTFMLATWPARHFAAAAPAHPGHAEPADGSASKGPPFTRRRSDRCPRRRPCRTARNQSRPRRACTLCQ